MSIFANFKWKSNINIRLKISHISISFKNSTKNFFQKSPPTFSANPNSVSATGQSTTNRHNPIGSIWSSVCVGPIQINPVSFIYSIGIVCLAVRHPASPSSTNGQCIDIAKSLLIDSFIFIRCFCLFDFLQRVIFGFFLFWRRLFGVFFYRL